MDISAIFSTMQAEISLAVILIIMLLADLILKQPNHKALQGLACGLLVVQIALNIVPVTGEAFGGMFVNTSMSSIVKTVLTAGTLLVFMQADSWINREDSRHKAGEFYVLTLSTLLGMYYMVSAGSFLLFYVGLELASIPLACLVAFDKYRHHSAEAGTKFILNAMFSSALMLYGLSLIYGTCGTMYFADMTAMLTGTPLQILAMVLFFAGLGFKLSLVPFHMWTPDTYQGAPTSITAYLSVISKGAAAFALMSILVKAFGPMVENWSLLIAIVTVVTITLANIMAILQHDLKRFMAYSSISQAGYIMLAVLGADGQGMASLVYYVIVYIVANLAVFGVITTVEQHGPRSLQRFLQNQPTPELHHDAGTLLVGRYSAVCRFLLEVLCVRFSVPCRPLVSSILGVGEYHHLTLLLLADCKSHVHHAERQPATYVPQFRHDPCLPGHLPVRHRSAWYLQQRIQYAKQCSVIVTL